jgi:hypothetical protein
MPPAPSEWRFSSGVRNSNAKRWVAAVAARQFGRVRYDQLRAVGIGRATINRWRHGGYLHPELPRVYAVGHPARSPESDLAAALLYAGPRAMLSHGTAIWGLELLKYPPREIIVSSPRRVRSPDNIVVHGRRQVERIRHNNLPVTTVTQAIIDFAAAGRPISCGWCWRTPTTATSSKSIRWRSAECRRCVTRWLSICRRWRGRAGTSRSCS